MVFTMPTSGDPKMRREGWYTYVVLLKWNIIIEFKSMKSMLVS